MKKLFLIFAIAFLMPTICFAQKWYVGVEFSTLWENIPDKRFSRNLQYSLSGTWYWKANDYFNVGAGLSASMIKDNDMIVGGLEDNLSSTRLWTPFLSPHISAKGILPVGKVVSFFTTADFGCMFFLSKDSNYRFPISSSYRNKFYIMPKLGIRFKLSEKGTAIYVAGKCEFIPYFHSKYGNKGVDYIGVCIGVDL